MAGWRDGLQKLGRFWQFRFTHRGMLHTGSTKCAALADAREWLAGYKSRLARGEMGQFEAPTVEKAFRNWLQIKDGFCSTANLKRARGAMELHVLPLIGSMKADQVRNEHVARVIQTYLTGPSPSGRIRTPDGANVVISYLRALFNYLVDNGYLAKIPFKLKKQRAQIKPRAVLPLEKVEAFLAVIDAKAHWHIGIAVRAMLYMGLRESEALGMRWEWLSPTGSHYTPGKTKGKEATALPFPPDLWARIQDLPRDSEWIIPGEGGNPHVQQFTRMAIRAAGKVIGVHGLTPHRLRATFATLLSRTGASVYEVQKLLRHKQLSTTLHYVQTDEQGLQEASRRLWNQAHTASHRQSTDPRGPEALPGSVSGADDPSHSLASAHVLEFIPMTQPGTRGPEGIPTPRSFAEMVPFNRSEAGKSEDAAYVHESWTCEYFER